MLVFISRVMFIVTEVVLTGSMSSVGGALTIMLRDLSSYFTTHKVMAKVSSCCQDGHTDLVKHWGAYMN